MNTTSNINTRADGPRRSIWQAAWFNSIGRFIALAVIFAFFAVAVEGGKFYTPRNLESILRQSAVYATAALGMTLVIIAGGIDLSIASIIALAVVVVALLTGGLVGYARLESQRALDLPAPDVTADLRPAAIARGAAIFHATCEACHRPSHGDRASGAPITDAPQWIGSLHSGNITSDPVAGIGALSDAQRGRMIRALSSR